MKIQIEESTLESMKAMVQELQDQRDELLACVKQLVALEALVITGARGTDLEPEVTMNRARAPFGPARFAIAKCAESTKVMQ